MVTHNVKPNLLYKTAGPADEIVLFSRTLSYYSKMPEIGQ
jgi:hypothetical protein